MNRQTKIVKRSWKLITLVITLAIIFPIVIGLATSSFDTYGVNIEVGQQTMYESDYDSKADMRAYARDYNEYAAANSFVLLKNKNDALPLARGSAVSAFGVFSTRMVLGGSGSGSANEAANVGASQGNPAIPGGAVSNLNVALNNAGGLRVNPTINTYYGTGTGSGTHPGIAVANYALTNGFVPPLSAAASFSRIEEDIYGTGNFANPDSPAQINNVNVSDSWKNDYSDAAIVVLSRSGTEGDEYALYNVPGHSDPLDTYYSPDDNEMKLIDYCAANFSKVVVLINAGNSFELTRLEDHDGVDAILYVGMPGGTGANAIGRVLTGEIAPSGRTADLYNADIKQDPTWMNLGANIQNHLTVTTVAEFNALRKQWNIDNGAVNTTQENYGLISGSQTPALSQTSKIAYTWGDPWDTSTRNALPASSSSWTADQWRQTGPVIPMMCTSGTVGWRGTPRISQYYMVRDKEGKPITPNTGAHMNNESRLGMIDYEEGIYLGYRFYETADQITVGGKSFFEAQFEANKPVGSTDTFADYVPAGKSDYYNRYNGVLYPFGYGLSYTNFKHEILDKADLETDAVNTAGKMYVNVRVTNKGQVPSRDVVQLYVTAPYEYGEIEKAHVSLVAFAKTSELKPGDSEIVKLEFLVKMMASFDWSDANNNSFCGYELDGGIYTFSLRENSHEVIDSFNTAIPATQYPTDEKTGTAVEPLFSPGDKQWDGTRTDDDYYSMYRSEFVSADGSSKASIMSRSNFLGTWPKPPVTGDLQYSDDALRIVLAQSAYSSFNDLETDPWYKSEEMFAKTGEELSDGSTATADGPYANWTQADGSLTIPTAATNNKRCITRVAGDDFPARTPIQLWDMSGVAYEDPLWDTFLNQLTFQEMGILLDTYGKDNQTGFIQVDSIGRPVIRAEDGPASLKVDSGSNSIGTAFIVAHNLACTFDVEIAYTIGRLLGHDGLYSGQVGWWGPAAQMHRSTASGRNFEYYSQDPLLNGFIGANHVMGAVDMGMIVFLKHLFFNEQETDRYSLTTFGDEQTVRELYLRPFELVFKYGKCNASMSAYPRSGLLHPTANYRLYETLLHDEWGFNGYSCTDYYNQQNVSTNADMTIRTNQVPLNRWSHIFGANIDGEWDPTLRGGRGGVTSEFGKNYSPTNYTSALGSMANLKLNTINNHHTTFGGPGPVFANNANTQQAISGTQQAGPSAVWKNNDTGTMYGIYNSVAKRYENSAGEELVLYENGDTVDAWSQWYAVRNLTRRVLYVQANSAAMRNGLVRNPWTDNMIDTNATAATTAVRTAPAAATTKSYNFDLSDPEQTPGLADMMKTGVVPTYHLMNMGTGLPDGLSLDPSSGQISGIPMKSGQFTFYVSIYSGDTWAGEGSGYTSGNSNTGGYRYAPVQFNLTVTDTVKNLEDKISDLEGQLSELLDALNNGDLKGDPGKSAYDLAKDAGYTGTLSEWLESLVGGQGVAGKSAYELAVAGGYTGTETEWLASLIGMSGTSGKSAYEIAKDGGYTGTEAEWLASLVGADGTNGKSAYEIAVAGGYTGTEAQWLVSLKGDTGTPGTNGKSAYDLAKDAGYTGTLSEWLASLVGKDGTNGKSAYEIAVAGGYTGTEAEWLASLIGADGTNGKSAYEIAVAGGYTGTEAQWLASLKGDTGDPGGGCGSTIGVMGGVMLGVIMLVGAAFIVRRKKEDPSK